MFSNTSWMSTSHSSLQIFYLRGVAKFWIGNTRDAAEDLKQVECKHEASCCYCTQI
jgi:hypothetical protein